MENKTRIRITPWLFVVGLGVICGAFAQTSVNPTASVGAAEAPGESVDSVQQPGHVDSTAMPDKPDNGTPASESLVSPSAANLVAPAVDNSAAPGEDQSAPLGGINVDNLPALDQEGTNLSSAEATAETGYKLWRLRPIAGVGYTYDDNIYIANSNRVASGIYSISGGLSFEMGDYLQHQQNFLQLSYIGTGLFYSQASQQNGYNQIADLLAQYTWTKLSVQYESRFQYLNGPNRDVGDFTTGTTLYNAIRFLDHYSDKTDLDLEFSQQSFIYQDNNSSYYQQVKFGGNYQYTDKLQLGLEGILGQVTAEQSPNGYYQTVNGRVHYDLTGKLALKGTAGLQANQYPTGNVSSRFTPVFSLGADYKPYEETTVSLVGYRNVSSSASLDAQSYVATGLSLGISQTIHEHWSPGVTVGYENDDYFANESSVQASRVDNYFYIKPSVSYSFLKYLQATVFYQFRQNNSNEQQYTWNDNQFGVELNTAF